MLLVYSDTPEPHLAWAKRYCASVQACLNARSDVSVNALRWDEDALCVPRGNDIIVFFTHGCISKSHHSRCPERCEAVIGNERACFHGNADLSPYTVKDASQSAARGIYGATTCLNGRTAPIHISGTCVGFVGYEKDFRHVPVPEGERNPFADVVASPFEGGRPLPGFQYWHRAIEDAYARWMRVAPETEWERKNLFMVRFCLRHNAKSLVYWEDQES